ncbi:MAG: hypothetical protein K2G84_01500 [Muribaculaceae bacterium]|nr:hypothetical protein [Muribaculaceae bacterium]
MKLKMIFGGMMMLVLAGCSNEPEPEPIPWPDPSYILPRTINMPAEAGTEDIFFYSPEDETTVQIALVATKYWQVERADQWEYYETLGEVLQTETVYRSAGYDSCPNDIDFSYTFEWATVSAYKEPGTTDGTLRISWEENQTSQYRNLYVYIKGSHEKVVMLTQDGSPEKADS